MQNPITNHLDIWTAAHKTRSSAGRGSNNKLDLYGIKKLRELILELAVRGKLAPQDANDEPASELLNKIAAEKARLIKEKKIKKTKILEDMLDGDKHFDVPQSWSWVHLNDLGDWGAGATPSRANSTYYGGSIPWFKSGELNEEFISQAEETVTELALKECSLRENKIGDVLIAMYGATIGKSSILSIPATTNQAVCACTPFNGVYNRYLLLLLRAFKSRFIGMGAGGAQPNISREKIIATLVPLPPFEEQHRIVAKVDELMAFCDQLEQTQSDNIAAHAQLVEALLTNLTNSSDHNELQNNWQRIAAHFDTLFTTEHSIDQLKQTILQLAVMGKLVPQNPNDEPASELLKKITAEKAQLIKEGKIKKDKPLPEITDEEKPFELPSGWEWVRVDSICDVQGGIQKQPIRAPKNNHFPYLRVANVQRGHIDTNEMERFELFDGELEKRALSKGDILIVEGNGSADEIGRCAIWSGQIENCVFQNHLIRVRSLHSGNEIFISKFLNSISGIAEMKRLAVTTSGLYNLSVGKIRAIAIPLPPVFEQHRIVTKVDELMALCDTLKTNLQNAQTTQLALADALVEQAVG